VGELIFDIEIGEANTSNKLIRHVDDCSHIDKNICTLIKSFKLVTLKLLFVSANVQRSHVMIGGELPTCHILALFEDLSDVLDH